VAILTTDGTQPDVAAKITSAATGDIVEIPAGTFTWTSGVTVNKAIHVRGAGAMAAVGRSESSVAFGGSGSKTFTTTESGLSITAGNTLRIYRTGGELNAGTGFGTGNGIWMDCTVTSYSGTALVVNVTGASATGTGSYGAWTIVSVPSAHTQIINNTSAGYLFNLTESTTGNVELSCITLRPGTSTEYLMRMTYASAGRPMLVHDCFYEVPTSGSGAIHCDTNRGVLWKTTFLAPSFSAAPLALHHKCPGIAAASWAAASSFGASDTNGTLNLYIEDCWFVAFVAATDADDGAREVIRRCNFDHAVIGSHGADTGNPAYGVRHWECYDSTFHHVNQGAASPGCSFQFYIRGGTFVICDNVIEDLNTGGAWGEKAEINMTVQNLTRNAGSFPLWGDGIAGNQIPAPRQVGYGNPTGASTTLDPLSIAVLGVSEPAYIWNNTGGYSIGISNYATPTGAQDSAVDYIVEGREYYHNAGAKPGYTKYTYPHPLRSGESPPPASSTPSPLGNRGSIAFML
jgi:hypothetical protein